MSEGDAASFTAYWERRKPQIVKRFRKSTPRLAVPRLKTVSLNSYGRPPVRKSSESGAEWLERLDKWQRARERWYIWAQDEAERTHSAACDRAWSQFTRDRFLWQLFLQEEYQLNNSRSSSGGLGRPGGSTNLPL